MCYLGYFDNLGRQPHLKELKASATEDTEKKTREYSRSGKLKPVRWKI